MKLMKRPKNLSQTPLEVVNAPELLDAARTERPVAEGTKPVAGAQITLRMEKTERTNKVVRTDTTTKKTTTTVANVIRTPGATSSTTWSPLSMMRSSSAQKWKFLNSQQRLTNLNSLTRTFFAKSSTTLTPKSKKSESKKTLFSTRSVKCSKAVR